MMILVMFRYVSVSNGYRNKHHNNHGSESLLGINGQMLSESTALLAEFPGCTFEVPDEVKGKGFCRVFQCKHPAALRVPQAIVDRSSQIYNELTPLVRICTESGKGYQDITAEMFVQMQYVRKCQQRMIAEQASMT